MQKAKLKKIIIFQCDTSRIQSSQTPLGCLHGEEEKSNPSDEPP